MSSSKLEKISNADTDAAETAASSTMMQAAGTPSEISAEAAARTIFSLEDIDGYCAEGLSAILRRPNVQDRQDGSGVEAICQAVNGPSGACPTKWGVTGKLVPRGSLGILDHSGRVEVVGEGRWVIGLHRAAWAKVESLTRNLIQHGPLTILRVPPGKLGRATDGGNPVLLQPGLHVHNNALFVPDSSGLGFGNNAQGGSPNFVDVNQEYVHYGQAHVIRVSKGKYAKVWGPCTSSSGIRPKLLREGLHVVNSALFSFEGTVDVSEPYVHHGALHVVQVPKGHVAKVLDEIRPRLLREGVHYAESANFKYQGLASLSDKVISHGTITVVRVNRGEIGLAWQENEPVFLEEPGLYSFDSPNFQFVNHAPATEKIVALGARKIITVVSGEVGISYDHGTLKLLGPGRHQIDDAAHIFHSFISTQQRSLRLVPEVTTARPRGAAAATAAAPAAAAETTPRDRRGAVEATTPRGTTPDLLICETRDLVKVGIRADVFYAIAEPEITIEKVNVAEIEIFVRETAIATLTNIIRSTTLNEIAQSKDPHAVSATKHAEQVVANQATGGASAPLFFDKAHDEFLSKLHDEFMARYGLDISNIRIESFKIMDEELAGNISRQALVTAQTENQLANLAGQTEIATAEQERVANVNRISATAAAENLRVETEAANRAKRSSAEAEAEMKRICTETAAKAEAEATLARARAEAEAIRIRAQAEAEAIERKAEAEAKRAELLSRTPLGAQLSLLQLYSEMVTKSNAGVEKVLVCDPTLQQGLGGSLFNPAGLMGLNRDLSALRDIGGEQAALAPGGKVPGGGYAALPALAGGEDGKSP